MTAIQGVYLSESIDLKSYYASAFLPYLDTVELHNPDEVCDPNAIEFALCWEPADDAFARYPSLRLISSIAAGVDTILPCSSLPAEVPVTRVRDPQQASDMAAFAVHHVVGEHRGMARYGRQQTARIWQRNPYNPTPEFRISVLGHGLMGRAVADALSGLGYDVVAFAKNPRPESGSIRVYSQDEGKLTAVRDAHILINLLPGTPETTGLLDRSVFSAMARGGMLINLGRGRHLVEKDLIEALDSGQLHHAAIDVVLAEPLSRDHVFWTHPKISLTPHIAAESRKAHVARLVCDDIRSLLEGKSPIGLIDRSRAY